MTNKYTVHLGDIDRIAHVDNLSDVHTLLHLYQIESVLIHETDTHKVFKYYCDESVQYIGCFKNGWWVR